MPSEIFQQSHSECTQDLWMYSLMLLHELSRRSHARSSRAQRGYTKNNKTPHTSSSGFLGSEEIWVYSAGTFSHLPSEVFVGRSSDGKLAAPCILSYTKLSAKATSLATGIPHTHQTNKQTSKRASTHTHIHKYIHTYIHIHCNSIPQKPAAGGACPCQRTLSGCTCQTRSGQTTDVLRDRDSSAPHVA